MVEQIILQTLTPLLFPADHDTGTQMEKTARCCAGKKSDLRITVTLSLSLSLSLIVKEEVWIQ